MFIKVLCKAIIISAVIGAALGSAGSSNVSLDQAAHTLLRMVTAGLPWLIAWGTACIHALTKVPPIVTLIVCLAIIFGGQSKTKRC